MDMLKPCSLQVQRTGLFFFTYYGKGLAFSRRIYYKEYNLCEYLVNIIANKGGVDQEAGGIFERCCGQSSGNFVDLKNIGELI